MIYSDFKGIKLSRLGMGNMRLPSLGEDKWNSPINYPESHKMMETALKGGVNYFDTAYVYQNGDSERCVGQGMKGFPRDSFYLATKFNYRANPDYKAVFEEQLKRLQTDHIDFYLLHCLLESNIDDYLNCGCIEYFEQMKKEGKIRYLGFSNHASPETLRRFADAHSWDFAQIQMNYLDWEFSTAEEEYNILTERNIPVVVMESVRGGRLSSLTPELDAKLKEAQPDWSVLSWAFRWLMTHENVIVMLSGMSTMEQVEDNLKTFNDGRALTKEQSDFLIDIAHKFKEGFSVPCTACRYCTPNCPQQLDIPAMLKVYNDYKYERRWDRGAFKDYDTDKLPSNCVGCGTCTEHCPQKIDIPSYMTKLAKLNETGKEE
ncbi:MAG: aldo/keto reductase [Spirochaetales bacterium]|nr:aldo/keto reductase [Spirochaetales bacterium]